MCETREYAQRGPSAAAHRALGQVRNNRDAPSNRRNNPSQRPYRDANRRRTGDIGVMPESTLTANKKGLGPSDWAIIQTRGLPAYHCTTVTYNVVGQLFIKRAKMQPL